MSEGSIHDHDPEGELTLQVISKAERFNAWMYDTILPYCSGKILEIGSGIGNISEFFLKGGFAVTLSDIRSGYCEGLKSKFSDYNNLETVLQMDLVDDEFEEKFQSFRNTFDTVFALNVIEHIEDDSLAIDNCRYLLKKRGRLIILVPAYQSLYNQFDTNLGHFRRYNLNALDKLLTSKGIKILHHQYFNLAGIPGWFLSGKILKKGTIPAGQMRIYNSMVPVFKLVDRIIFNSAGLSVISIGEVT